MFTSLGISLTSSSYFNDKRLSKRFGEMVVKLCDNFGHSLPQSMGNKHQTKAAYNFMNNEKVSVEGIYSSDAYRLKEEVRTQESQTYLSLSDTSNLNFTSNKSSSNLDYLNTIKDKGLYMHSLILCDAQSCPLGLLQSKYYNRKAEALHKTARTSSSELSKQSIEEKESYRWLEDLQTLHTLFGSIDQHRFVHIMDSEGDIFEVFAARRYEHIHILTRVNHDRRVVDNTLHIKDLVRQKPSMGQLKVTVSDRRKSDKAQGKNTPVKREALLELRFTEVKIDVPTGLKVYQKDKGYKPLDLYVVSAKEIPTIAFLESNDEFEPIEWFLITSMPIQTLQDAIDALTFYAARWRIEDFHLVLKQGAKVEEFQYEDEPQLKNALTVYSIVAIQILRLRYLKQYYGEEPVEKFGFQPQSYQIVAQYLIKVKKIKIIKVEKPTVNDFITLITTLGSGNPKATGVRALWRGLRDFDIIYQTFCLMNNQCF